MKYQFVCCALVLCCLCPVAVSGALPPQTRQYAYIGGYSGIFGFWVKSDGRLLSMQVEPLAKGLFLDQLLVDTRARTIFGTSVDNNLYSYAIGPDGRLSLKSEIPFDAASGTAVIDSRTHHLYAADGDHSLLVYDISNPAHLVRQRNVVTPITIRSVIVNQANHSLLIWGKYARTTGQGGSVLLHYSLHPQSKHARKKAMLTALRQGVNTSTLAGPYLVAGNENTTLTVYSMSGRSVQALSHQPLLEADAAHLPSSIVYRHTGSFLYISTYYGAGSARAAQPASAIIVCRLGNGGQLGPQATVGEPVPNPRPCLDETGRFLYIIGEEGTIDAYKLTADGQLVPVGSRLKIASPTGMVFVSSLKSSSRSNRPHP